MVQQKSTRTSSSNVQTKENLFCEIDNPNTSVEKVQPTQKREAELRLSFKGDEIVDFMAYSEDRQYFEASCKLEVRKMLNEAYHTERVLIGIVKDSRIDSGGEIYKTDGNRIYFSFNHEDYIKIAIYNEDGQKYDPIFLHGWKISINPKV